MMRDQMMAMAQAQSLGQSSVSGIAAGQITAPISASLEEISQRLSKASVELENVLAKLEGPQNSALQTVPQGSGMVGVIDQVFQHLRSIERVNSRLNSIL